MMQIVIDISDEDYNRIKMIPKVFDSLTSRLYYAVNNCTPLPEHHGRLIDAERLMERLNLAEENFKADHVEELEYGDSFCDGILSAIFNICAMVQNAPTIIEGVKADDE